MTCRWVALFALAPLWGCTVTAVSQGADPRPSNSCKSDADCGQDRCIDGLCQTLSGQLESLLISATPPSDSGLPHLTFVTQIDVPTSGGHVALMLPGPSHVSGSFILPEGETCYPGFISDDLKKPFLEADDGKSLPVTVTLALSQRVLGLWQQPYFASATTRNVQGSYVFDVQVPQGEYDVYLVPPPKQQGCAVPPQLYRNFRIEGENALVTLPLSGVSQLPLSIRWPKTSRPLVGWRMDIIEPLGGNPISTDLVLGEPTDAGATAPTVAYAATLSYSTVVTPARADATASAGELLRLRPPADVVAPTIFLDRSALGLLLAPGELVKLDRFTRLPDPVRVEGQVTRLDDGTSVAGYVTFISTEIYGVDAGIFASYQTTVEVAADGALHVELPPGKYRLQAVPGGGAAVAGTLAGLETTWEVPADTPLQYGKVLEFEPLTAVVGQTPFFGAQVQAVPSHQLVLPFAQAFGTGPFAPRATTGLVNDQGRFRLGADPGRFDLSVQAPEGLGFAWYVRPGLQVGQHDVDLGGVSLPIPAFLSGRAGVSIAGADAALGSAAIRAYAYLDKDFAYTRDVTQAVSVVQVAESRTDEIGGFRLLVPSRIAAPK